MPRLLGRSACFAVLLAIMAAGCGDRPAGDADPADRGENSPPAASPTASTGDAISDSEIRAHRLDMPTFQRWHRAQLAAAERPDIQFGGSGDEDDDEDLDQEMNGSAATELLRRIEAHAEARGVLRGAGMAPREYVLVLMAFGNAVVGNALEEAGHQPPPLARPDNIQFVRQHLPEIERMMEEQRAKRRSAD
jgi:hypothetical protein